MARLAETSTLTKNGRKTAAPRPRKRTAAQQRSDAAKRQLRTSAAQCTLHNLAHEAPGKLIGIAVGVGVLMGLFPSLRRAVLRTLPLMKIGLDFLR